MVQRGDMFYAFWSSRRGTPPKFRWPLLWGVATGFVVQTVWGIFPVMLGFALLAGADTDRCPLAAPLRPFFGYILGAALATMTWDWCLLWGVFFDIKNPSRADPFLLSRQWWRTIFFGEPLRRPTFVRD